MKLALPLDETKENVCVTFGRAPYFLFVEDGKQVIKENPGSVSQGGAGLQAAQFLVDEHVDGLITRRCGENSAEVLNEANIKVYETKELKVELVLAAYQDGKLELLTSFHAGYVGLQ